MLNILSKIIKLTHLIANSSVRLFFCSMWRSILSIRFSFRHPLHPAPDKGGGAVHSGAFPKAICMTRLHWNSWSFFLLWKAVIIPPFWRHVKPLKGMYSVADCPIRFLGSTSLPRFKNQLRQHHFILLILLLILPKHNEIDTGFG